MKRVHLVEFEDLSWFPKWTRRCMTRLIILVHNILKSKEDIADLLSRLLSETNNTKIVDTCSGSGGAMPGVVKILREEKGMDVDLKMTDLYPDEYSASKINAVDDGITYRKEPLDATKPNKDIEGVRTMICSFHHMNPENAKKILASAQEARQPLLIFEISDNSQPIWLFWIAIPINIIATFLMTPFVRPLTWRQLVFTYIIPVIPIFYAWDGAASNPRTYTLEDMDELLQEVPSTDGYTWEKGRIKNRGRKLYLIGKPV